MYVPASPKIYHIVPIDRLPSIVEYGCLWSDREVTRRGITGTTIGMNSIKERRLNELTLNSHPGLYVGDCVPFYFCPRSVMLYFIHKGNRPELTYRGGQGPIVHLEADLRQAVAWANERERRWAFTSSNAGSYRFDDYKDLAHLDKINWDAVRTNWWSGSGIEDIVKESKQAEFLFERSFPWELVSRIGVRSQHIRNQVKSAIEGSTHRPRVKIRQRWYY